MDAMLFQSPPSFAGGAQPTTTMAGEAAITIAASSLLPPSPSSHRHRPKPSPAPLRRHLRHPLLSDVRRDLTATAPAASSPATRGLLRYYARLASKLAESGRLRDFLMIAESVITSDAVAADCPQFVARINTRLVARGVSKVLEGGNLGEILEFLSYTARLGFCPSSMIDKPAVKALGTQCRRLLDEGRVEEFVGLMETLAGYRLFLKDVLDPVDVLKIMVEKCDPSMAISARRVDLAQEIYQEIKTMGSRGALKLDVITYSTMIKLFADAKMWQMALSIKEDMVLADVSPNIVTWSSLIAAFANAGLVDRTIQVFEEMLSAGCEPNAHCCNILLSACVDSCQYDKAFRLFNTWKESGFMISSIVEDRECSNRVYDQHPSNAARVVPFKPTIATYNILMKACGTDHYRARALMDEMKLMDLCPNHISWSILIDIYGTSQNMRGAMEAFKAMRDSGIHLDVIAYTTAIKACVESKNVRIAFSLFEEMKRHQLKPNQVTYNTLLRARQRYGSLHEVQQCLAIYQDMRKAGYSSNDYYLRELLEEWCEGVICGSNQNQGVASVAYSCKSEMVRSHNLLLEKVAMHLQNDGGENQAIDIRGLTKVEARIVVLSVLRMIKERYRLGEDVEDDLVIISGSENSNIEVQHAIVKVLQDELGLLVMTSHGVPYDGNYAPNPSVGVHSTSLQKTMLRNGYRYLARRPQDLGVLRVTKLSLYYWLQKKFGIRVSS